LAPELQAVERERGNWAEEGIKVLLWFSKLQEPAFVPFVGLLRELWCMAKVYCA
jgi:hypothetical protein